MLRYNINVELDFLSMARRRGNPDFGTKYRFDFGRKEPLSAKVTAQVYPKVKQELKDLAEEKNCTVPDVIRAAIDRYLAEERTKNAF